MIRAGDMWIPSTDTYFRRLLESSGDKFDYGHLEKSVAYCKSRRVAVDGGAHVGTWSKHLSTMFDVVVAFEPSRDNYSCLLRNISDANIDNVITVNSALGESSYRATVKQDFENSGATYLDRAVGDAFVTSLDEYKIIDLDYLKLDIEGFEPFALSGAEHVIKRFRPVILIEQKQETARYGLSYLMAGSLLESWGFRLVARYNKDYVYTSS